MLHIELCLTIHNITLELLCTRLVMLAETCLIDVLGMSVIVTWAKVDDTILWLSFKHCRYFVN